MSVKLYQRSRILRNYRRMGPSKFHDLNQRVTKGLADNARIPASIWAAYPNLLPSYLSTSEKYDAVYHQALYGSRLDIAERDLIQAQTVEYLDEIASILEAAAVRIPDLLISSGFDLAKERRSNARGNAPHSVTEDVNAPNEQPPSN